MKPAHLDRFQPVCPLCRLAGRTLGVLELGPVVSSRDDQVLEGVLVCPNLACRREHPIIDGVPIVVADIASFLQSQLDAMLMRDDLSSRTRGMLADGLPGDSWYSTDRNLVSSYCHSHYGPGDRGVAAVLDDGLALLDDPPSGVWLDAGCSVGRAAFELAARTGEPVLAVDLNFSMLRIARRLQDQGHATIPLRRVGVVYDDAELVVETPHRDQVGFWACDATALPFPNQAFAGAVSLSVLDCLSAPVTHLAELGRVVSDGGPALLASPYDWTGGVSPVPTWIGGHSARSDSGGSSVAELERLLGEHSPPELGIRLRLEASLPDVPWQVRIHERSVMSYALHLVLARSRHGGTAAPR